MSEKKIWQSAPFNAIYAVQVYGGPSSKSIPPPPREGCPTNRAALMFETADHRALDLCVSCSTKAFEDGAYTNRFALDNLTAINAQWFASRTSWHKLLAHDCFKGKTYPEVREATNE